MEAENVGGGNYVLLNLVSYQMSKRLTFNLQVTNVYLKFKSAVPVILNFVMSSPSASHMTTQTDDDIDHMISQLTLSDTPPVWSLIPRRCSTE